MFRSIRNLISGLVTFFILVYFSHSALHAAELSQTTQLLPPLIKSQPKRIFVFANDPVTSVPVAGSSTASATSGPSYLWTAYAQEGTSSSTFTQPKVGWDQNGKPFIASALMEADGSANCHIAIKQGIYAWDGATGTLLPGFPVLAPYHQTSSALCGRLSIVAVGDVAGGPDSEIIALAGDTQNGGGILVISPTGQLISHLLQFQVWSGWDQYHAVLVPDLDGDGKLEILTFSGSGLQVINASGSSIASWNVSGRLSDPAVVDFGDGKGPAILISVATGMYPSIGVGVLAFELNGTSRWSWSVNGLFPITAEIVSGDVNGDGYAEVVLKTQDWNTKVQEHFVIDRNGQQLARWPNGVQSIFGQRVTLGDLNNDHALEIIYHDSVKVYVTDWQGQPWPGFPRYIWDGPSTPVLYINATDVGVADLDGDGYQEIFLEAMNARPTGGVGGYFDAIFAFDRFGNTMSGFPYALRNYVAVPVGLATWVDQYPPSFADINNDGMSEIIASKGFGRIEAFTLNTPMHDSADFPEFGANRRNTKLVPTLSKGLKRYGGSTHTCQGPMAINAYPMPQDGKPFTLTSTSGPPNAQGLLVLANSPDTTGSSIAGVRLHVGLSQQQFFAVPVSTNSTGFGQVSISIPAGTAGLSAYTQFIWNNTATCNGNGPLSASDALAITVQP